jgi:hypothetical protein
MKSLIVLTVAVLVTGASFALGVSTYCVVAITGVAGLVAKVGRAECGTYFSAMAALLTPVIGLTAAYIAYQQYLTSREKLRQDLYERRLKILRALSTFIENVMRDGAVTGPVVTELMDAIGERHYLFGDDLSKYLDEFRDRAWKAYVSHYIGGQLPVGPARSKHFEESSEAVLWFHTELPGLRKRFEPYLRVSA